MRIKYGELPKREVLQKLLSVSFNTPRKNLAVYKFCHEMVQHISYIENERFKIVQKYGEQDKADPARYFIPEGTEESKHYLKEFAQVLDMEIDEDITPLPLAENDFLDNCFYSPDKADWLNAGDIGKILMFCE